MIKKGKTTLVLLTAVSLSHAGAMSGVVSASYQQNAYIKLGAGGSASMSSHIDTDPLYWATSPQGYNNNIGSTALYSAAVGYNFCELMSADFEYTYRPSYSYSKYQTSTATGTVDLFGNKTRYFNLESNSIMANVYAHGQGISSNLVRRVSDNSIVQPFLGGGLGVSYNTMSALRSVAPNGTIATLSPYRKRASFAWQLSTGIELISTNHLQLAAGYRYYNGGTYKSQNFSSGQSVTPWTGKLQANEGFMTITYQLPT